MKKILMILGILLIAISTTACINNLAVQDLNKKALEFANQGDYTQAIERLKSSIDLDSSLYETHYNLAVVYTKAERYPEAIEEYKKVLELNPKLSEVYSSLATTLNNLAIDMSKGIYRIDEAGTVYKWEDVNKAEESDEPYKLTDIEKNYTQELYKAAIENYNQYLELNSNAEDRAQVEQQIENIKGYLEKED